MIMANVFSVVEKEAMQYDKNKMASLEDKLHAVPDVDIDNSGKFKYVLIKVCAESKSKCIVRGFDWAEFHGIALYCLYLYMI